MDKEFISVTHASRYKQAVMNGLGGFTRFMYNKEERTVIGRDGLSWVQISLAYAVFYASLASFFVGMLAIFVAQLDFQLPTYYAESSVMATRNNINPGLGFRPQVDPEDSLIYFNTSEPASISTLTRSLTHFLAKYYDDSKLEEAKVIRDCQHRQDYDTLRALFRNESLSCEFDYRVLLRDTTCDPNKQFGYAEGPCVAIKLNKIVSWTPEPYVNSTLSPLNQWWNSSDQSTLSKNIVIRCDGEYGADRDNIDLSKVVYYSVGASAANITHLGLLPFYYYPYYNQASYRQPLVFVHFRHLPENILLNIVCRAYASNIDSDDKLNLRGMAKFQLFVTK